MAGREGPVPAKSRRTGWPAGRGEWPGSTRGPWRSCRWLRGEEWWPGVMGARRAAAGDGLVCRRRGSDEVWDGQSGSKASGGGGESH